MKPAPHKLPRPKTQAQLSAIGRKGAAASLRAAWLNGNDRPPPTLPVVKWLNRPDPFEDRPKT